MAEKILAMPKGPRFRATRRATACLVLSASIAIAGCGWREDRNECELKSGGVVVVKWDKGAYRDEDGWEWPTSEFKRCRRIKSEGK